MAEQATVTSAAPGTKPEPVLMAHRPEWSNKGAEIIANRKAAYARYPEYAAHADPIGSAFQSLPIDILEPGIYTVRFPVDDSFDYPRKPTGFGMAGPDDRGFMIDVVEEQPQIVDNGSERYFDLPLKFMALDSGEFKPYPRLSIWLY
jgi:hypothetical protein